MFAVTAVEAARHPTGNTQRVLIWQALGCTRQELCVNPSTHLLTTDYSWQQKAQNSTRTEQKLLNPHVKHTNIPNLQQTHAPGGRLGYYTWTLVPWCNPGQKCSLPTWSPSWCVCPVFAQFFLVLVLKSVAWQCQDEWLVSRGTYFISLCPVYHANKSTAYVWTPLLSPAQLEVCQIWSTSRW